MNAQGASGGYRDEREAALAQVQSLQQKLNELEPEVQRLRFENQQLRAELSRYAGFSPSPAPSRSSPIILAIVAVLAMLLVAGGAGFFLLSAPSRSTPPAMPSAVPVSAPSMPSVAPVPTSVAPMPSVAPSAAAAS